MRRAPREAKLLTRVYAGGAVADRRRYPRLAASVTYQPAGAPLFHHRRNAHDISLGGMRVFTDDSISVGSRLDLEILPAAGEPIRCWAVVVWVTALDPGAPAKYDVGLRFSDMEPEDLQRLAGVLLRPS